VLVEKYVFFGKMKEEKGLGCWGSFFYCVV